MSLGKNIEIEDGGLRLELNEWLRPIQENYKTLEQNFLRLEPEKNTVTKGKKDKVEAIRMNWLGLVCQMRTNRAPDIREFGMLIPSFQINLPSSIICSN